MCYLIFSTPYVYKKLKIKRLTWMVGEGDDVKHASEVI